MGGIVIHRSHHAQQYVVVPNAIARDKTLSFRARGLLVMLLSLPPEWHVTADMLAEDNPDSRTAVRAAMAELRAEGYVHLITERGKDGRTRRRLEVFDTRTTKRGQGALGATCENSASSQVAPTAGIPAVGKPAVGIPAVNRSTGRSTDRSTDGSTGEAFPPQTRKRVHGGPPDHGPDDQQPPISPPVQSPAADRNARAGDGQEPGGGDDFEDARRREMDKLIAWMREHPDVAGDLP